VTVGTRGTSTEYCASVRPVDTDSAAAWLQIGA
jgi:hypothetical protein